MSLCCPSRAYRRSCDLNHDNRNAARTLAPLGPQ